MNEEKGVLINHTETFYNNNKHLLVLSLELEEDELRDWRDFFRLSELVELLRSDVLVLRLRAFSEFFLSVPIF